MAKGWSFSGLVAALKSAAFKDVGSAKGQIPVVGDKNLFINDMVVVDNFNFATYKYVAGEVLSINGNNCTNWPFPKYCEPTGIVWSIHVESVSNSGSFVRATVSSGEYFFAYTRSNGVNTSRRMRAEHGDLGTTVIDNLYNAQDYGIYSQYFTAQATTERGYPIQEAGVLEVMQSAYKCMQRYTTHDSNRFFVRNRSSTGNWNAWKEQLIRFSELDVDFGKVRIRRNAPLVFTDSNGSNTLQIQPSGSGSSVVTLHGNDETNKLRLLLNGNIRVTPESAGWYTTYDQPDFAGAYSCGAVTVPGNGYFYPLISCKLVTKDYGYPATVSFGAVNSTTDFPYAVISIATRSGGDRLWNYAFKTNGNIDTPTGTISRGVIDTCVTNLRLGGLQGVALWNGPGYDDAPPYVITGVVNNNKDEFPDHIRRRPLQFARVGTGWINFGT